MNVTEFRKQYPMYNDLSDQAVADSLWAKHGKDYQDLGEQEFKKRFLSTAGASGEQNGKPPSQGGVPAIPLTTPGDVAMAVPRFAGRLAKDIGTSLYDIPRGLVGNPIAQIMQNRPATPKEEGQSLSGLAGLVTMVTGGPVAKLAEGAAGKTLIGRLLANAGAGSVLGAEDAAIRSKGDAGATGKGMAAGAVAGPIFGEALRPFAAQAGLPNNPASRIARSPLGTVVSSVTDRMRGMGEHGQALDDMIEQVVQQSQREPGKYLQPFDRAVHAVTGRKGRLSVDDRSAILGALERGVNPNTLRPELRPIYDQMKAYFDATPQRGTAVGAMVNKGGKRVPIAQATIPDYFHHAALTVKQLKDKNIRPSVERNLMDKGVAASPQEAQQLVDDMIVWMDSKGKQGGQLAIKAFQGLNPNKTPQQLQSVIFRSKPPLRVPASGLEYAREINTPFYDPRPEAVFPSHVQNTEKALAELQHYGLDAKNLTSRIAQLPSDLQHEAEHLVRTATESHQPWDPRVEKALSFMRQAQLATFSPLTTIKNLSQRNNNVLTSDLAEGLSRGGVPLPGSRALAARSGALAEGAHETLAQALGGESSVSRGYLKGLGFSGVERGNRQAGAQTGLAEAAKYAKRLLKNPQDELATSRLAREGIDPAQVQGGTLSADQEAQAALMRSNKAQFRTHPKDLPDWFTSNPVSRTMATFKSFDYQQTRLILDETVGRMTSGLPGDKARGMRNAAILGTLYPAVGEGINTLYSVALRRETPGHAVARTKEFLDDTAKATSGQMNPIDYVTKYKGRYGQDLVAGSAPGIGGTFVQAMEFGKGDKGGSLLKSAMGPTISRPYEAIQLAHDAATQKDKFGNEKPMTPAQNRQALRLILGGTGTMAGPWLYPDKNSAGNRNK